MDNNYVHHEEWYEITYPFLKFNGTAVEVWKWISNFIPHFGGMGLLIHAGLTNVSRRGIGAKSLGPTDWFGCCL